MTTTTITPVASPAVTPIPQVPAVVGTTAVPAVIPTNFNFSTMDYHAGTTALTAYLATCANSEDYHFIRCISSFYIGLVTTTMRNTVVLPGNRPVPTNIFAMGLLPSGQG